MHNTLCDLFNGNIVPYAAPKNENPEYDLAFKELCELEQALIKTLKGRPLREFERLMTLQGKLGTMESEGSFVYGFRFGARLMLEVLGTYEVQNEL